MKRDSLKSKVRKNSITKKNIIETITFRKFYIFFNKK